MSSIIFLGASPEITLFLRPWIYNGIFVEHIIQKVEEIEDQDTNFFFIRGGLGIG